MITPPPIFQVGHLERMPLGTPYPGIVAHVRRLLGKFPARTELVIDVTGVGKPVFEMFTYSGISPLGVLITAGTAETRDGAICGVPKLTLVSRLQALLHQGRLKIHRELAEAETLVRELQDFRVEYTAAGHLTFNARSGKHDDLVLALAIAVWRAHGGGMPSRGHFETVRQLGLGAKASEPRYYVGVDLGQSRDPTAIAVVRQVDPPPEPGAVEAAELGTDEAIAHLPAPIPASTAPPPKLGSAEWQHQIAEGQKALLRRQGFSYGGPLKAIPIPPSSPATSGGSRPK